MNESVKIKIIYEDNHLLIVEKPVNTLSQADDTKDPDMLTLLKKYLKEKYRKPGSAYLGLVHRLDRPVGGVMVFAKTSKAASRISKQIKSGEFRKKYLAVVRGKPDLQKGKLIDYLLKDEKTNTVKVIVERLRDGKKAVLSYEVIETKDDLSLVKVDLYTGRPHQIRVQFANIGCPLYGDQKYGADVNTVGQQIALWSNEIEFIHPTLKTDENFFSFPPNENPWNLFTIEKQEIED